MQTVRKWVLNAGRHLGRLLTLPTLGLSNFVQDAVRRQSEASLPSS